MTSNNSIFNQIKCSLHEAEQVLIELSRFLKELAIFLTELAGLVLIVYLVVSHTKVSIYTEPSMSIDASATQQQIKPNFNARGIIESHKQSARGSIKKQKKSSRNY